MQLRNPTYRIVDAAYGPLHEDVMISPRLAPPMIGMGLLEAIHEADIVANAHRRDDPDGVVGKPRYLRNIDTGEVCSAASAGRPGSQGSRSKPRARSSTTWACRRR